jgi:hypothetical protein
VGRAPLGSVVGPRGEGTSCLYKADIILNEIWTQDKIYILLRTFLR